MIRVMRTSMMRTPCRADSTTNSRRTGLSLMAITPIEAERAIRLSERPHNEDFRTLALPGGLHVRHSQARARGQSHKTAAYSPSFRSPRATICSALSGSGRCSAEASDHSARIQTSISLGSVRMTGIAFGWIGATTPFGSQVRKA